MKNKKIVINILLVCIIIAIIIWLIIEEYKDKNIEQENQQSAYKTESISTQENIIIAQIEPKREYPKEQIEEKFKGYLVEAKLEIPKISLETYILKEYSIEALNVSVTKFWGASANEIGNFCVAGHNFKNRNMFYNLKNLKIGDAFFISDNNIGKIEYKIYNIYKVLPNDVSCLLQDTKGNREVTLITCTNDSKERIIIKAKEIK